MISAVVKAVNVNPEGGVPKHSVDSAFLRKEGVEGDRQNDNEVKENSASLLQTGPNISFVCGHVLSVGITCRMLRARGASRAKRSE